MPMLNQRSALTLTSGFIALSKKVKATLEECYIIFLSKAKVKLKMTGVVGTTIMDL